MTSAPIPQVCMNALIRLSRWRRVFASWAHGPHLLLQPGPISQLTGPEQASMDREERLLALRAELTGMVSLLLSKGVVTEEEVQKAIAASCVRLVGSLESMWPGIVVTEEHMLVNLAQALPTLEERGIVQRMPAPAPAPAPVPDAPPPGTTTH